jgi:hypothetical protein
MLLTTTEISCSSEASCLCTQHQLCCMLGEGSRSTHNFLAVTEKNLSLFDHGCYLNTVLAEYVKTNAVKRLYIYINRCVCVCVCVCV